jgi:hypothetical protein
MQFDPNKRAKNQRQADVMGARIRFFHRENNAEMDELLGKPGSATKIMAGNGLTERVIDEAKKAISKGKDKKNG